MAASKSAAMTRHDDLSVYDGEARGESFCCQARFMATVSSAGGPTISAIPIAIQRNSGSRPCQLCARGRQCRHCIPGLALKHAAVRFLVAFDAVSAESAPLFEEEVDALFFALAFDVECP